MEKFTIVLPTEDGEEIENDNILKLTPRDQQEEPIQKKQRNFNSPAAEDNSLLPDTIVDDNEEDHHLGVKLLIIIGILLVLGLIGMRILMKYTDSDIRMSYDREDSVESKYVYYNDNLLRYNTDGIFYTTMNGDLIWNSTYDMTNPSIKTKSKNILVFDKKGNDIVFLNDNGLVKSVKTEMPIIDGAVSASNTFAILLQENNVSYIRLYDMYGDLVAEGEIHPENGGFPVSISLSENGSRMALSLINLNVGKINSTIEIYDYSKAGKEQSNNIIATYSYGNMIIPEISFIKNDKLIAFGDKVLILIGNDSKCSIEKEIYADNSIRSIFYNNDHFGYIYEAVSKEGKLIDRMDVYNPNGYRNMSVDLDDSYDDVYIMSNNEIVLQDSHNISVYNIYGVNRFKKRFDANIYKVMPGSMSSRYYLVEETYTEEISIK